MPLTGPQITSLATTLDEQWDLNGLRTLAGDFSVNLDNIAPGATMFASSVALLTQLSTGLRPRDRDLLEQLRLRCNAIVQAAVKDLLNPPYFSPTGQALDAIVLGRMAFVDRADLREQLREFTEPSLHTTRMLVVRGDEPGGKSYTWGLLQHLAFACVGATPQLLELRNAAYTPRQLFEAVFSLLGLDEERLPKLKDDPQLARVESLLVAFKGEVSRMQGERYWLVIDDLNDDTVPPATVDAAFALARAVEQARSDHLWIVLLGYKPPITAPELRFVAQDDARFPSKDFLAEHFQAIAAASVKPLGADEALELAQGLFDKHGAGDKAAMVALTMDAERAGEKLRNGERP